MPPNRRAHVRSGDLQVPQRQGQLEVRGQTLKVALIDLSPGGFGVWIDQAPQIEPGEVLRLRTVIGWCKVRVVKACVPYHRGGFRLSLQLLDSNDQKTLGLIPADSSSQTSNQLGNSSVPVEKTEAADSKTQSVRSGHRGWFADSEDENSTSELIGAVVVGLLVALAPSIWDAMGRQPRLRRTVSAAQPITAIRQSEEISKRIRLSETNKTRPTTVAKLDELHPSDPSGPIFDSRSTTHGQLTVGSPDQLVEETDLELFKSQIATLARTMAVRIARAPSSLQKFQDVTTTKKSQPVDDSSPGNERSIPSEHVDLQDPPRDDTDEVRTLPPRKLAQNQQDRAGAMKTFSAGLRSLSTNELATAMRAFEAASLRLPQEPTFRYFLAITQYLSGRRSESEQTLATAVQLEKQQPAPGLGRVMQRVQGPHRTWMENARRRAQVGPYRPASFRPQP